MYLPFITRDTYKLTDESRLALENTLLNTINRNPSQVYGKDETMLDKLISIFRVFKERKTTSSNIPDNPLSEVSELASLGPLK